MKNLMFALMLFATPLAAQDTTMVSIPKSSLSASQLVKIETQEIQEKAQAYGAWVGVGKEVGEAVNSSLSAISDNAAKFADTKVGKFSMAIVAWKVVGQDILGVLYAFVIGFIGLPVLIWSYRKTAINKVLDREIVKDDKVVERVYRELSYNELSERSGYAFCHAALALVLLAAGSLALFG